MCKYIYLKYLSLNQFCYLWGSWNQSPVETEGQQYSIYYFVLSRVRGCTDIPSFANDKVFYCKQGVL